MTLHRLVVHDRPFVLDDPAAETVAAELVAAVRAGGDFVAFTTTTGVEHRVLVTPATPVHLERIPEPPADDPDAPHTPDDDYDFSFDL